MHTSVLYSRKIAALDVPGVVSGMVPVSSWYPDKKPIYFRVRGET